MLLTDAPAFSRRERARSSSDSFMSSLFGFAGVPGQTKYPITARGSVMIALMMKSQRQPARPCVPSRYVTAAACSRDAVRVPRVRPM